MYENISVSARVRIENLSNVTTVKNGVTSISENNHNLVSYGNDVYLNDNADYHNFTTTGINSLKYFRNMLPIERSPQISTISFECNEDQAYSENEIVVWSPGVPFSYLFGFKVTNIEIGKINQSNKTILTLNGSKDMPVFDFKKSITYFSSNFSQNNFIYFSRILGSFKLNPLNEIMIHPFNSSYYDNIRIWMESDNTKNKIYNFYNTTLKYIASPILLYRPLYMFSNNAGITWKTWDGNAFVSPTISGTFPTFDEFISQGTTYTSYASISSSAWQSFKSDGDIVALANCYPVKIFVKHSTFNVDISEFLFTYERNARRAITKGNL